MFRREQEAPAAEAPAQSQEPRQKVPAEDAHCFQPSSFGSRKATAEAANAQRGIRRLASMGETEFTQRNHQTGVADVLAATLYFDVDHPRERFVEIDGMHGLHPLQDEGGVRDDVTPLPPLRGRTRGTSGLSLPAAHEPPPRPV